MKSLQLEIPPGLKKGTILKFEWEGFAAKATIKGNASEERVCVIAAHHKMKFTQRLSMKMGSSKRSPSAGSIEGSNETSEEKTERVVSGGSSISRRLSSSFKRMTSMGSTTSRASETEEGEEGKAL